MGLRRLWTGKIAIAVVAKQFAYFLFSFSLNHPEPQQTLQFSNFSPHIGHLTGNSFVTRVSVSLHIKQK
jgi:hypothetical protein